MTTATPATQRSKKVLARIAVGLTGCIITLAAATASTSLSDTAEPAYASSSDVQSLGDIEAKLADIGPYTVSDNPQISVEAGPEGEGAFIIVSYDAPTGATDDEVIEYNAEVAAKTYTLLEDSDLYALMVAVNAAAPDFGLTEEDGEASISFFGFDGGAPEPADGSVKALQDVAYFSFDPTALPGVTYTPTDG